MSDTRQQILDDIKAAMKAGDKERLGTLRLISAEIKQKEVDERIELSNDDMLVLLDKMLKQRRESIAQYKNAGREDLLAVEEKEVAVISEYLPEALSDAEIADMISTAISETKASSIKDMGKVMASLKPKMQGRADMSVVSAQIKKALNA